MSDDVTVFNCTRGGTGSIKPVKIQLEISQETFDAYREKAKGSQFTAKQLMENMLRNFIQGVSAK
jgi:hypothetical protein